MLEIAVSTLVINCNQELTEPAVDVQCLIALKSSIVLHHIQATEEDGSSDEDLDDEAMMKLDKSMAVLFSEQKKKTQAKKDEKTKLQKEKALVRDFKIKVCIPHSAL